MLSKRKVYLLLFFFMSLLFVESVIRFAAGNEFSFDGVMISFLFSLSFAAVYYFFCTLSSSRINYIFSLVILAGTGIVFSSQLLYFKIFKTYYSLYSAANASQITEFWRDTGVLIIENIPWLLLFFSPLLLMITYGKNVLSFEKLTRQSQLLLTCCFLLSHSVALYTVNVNDKGAFSAYDVYFSGSAPARSAEKLGLLTAMRIDFQGLVLKRSPELKLSSRLNIFSDIEHASELNDESYNIMDINFNTLISEEQDERIKQMHNYFANAEPSAKNDFTGKYEGYNLIFITAEAFSPYAVHKEATPTLYKMMHEGYQFTNFYNPLWEVSTSDGEYVAVTGLLPKNGVWSFYKSGSNHMPFVMGNQLKNLGYRTVAYHNHTHSYYRRDISHPNMGYEYKGIGSGLDVKEIWPASDLEMMEKTIPEYINEPPFHAYYMTVSGHMQYNFSGNNQAQKNRDHVAHMPYSEQARAYLATQVELDRAMEYLVHKLEEAGEADKTLIALSADHYPYGLDREVIDELAGHPVEKNFELYKSPFILYTKGMEPATVTKPASSLDIIPTLSNLLGLNYDSRLLMGRDIFSDAEPLVIFSNKSFITSKGKFNSETDEFILSDGEEANEVYVKSISDEVTRRFQISAEVLDTDYYAKVLRD